MDEYEYVLTLIARLEKEAEKELSTHKRGISEAENAALWNAQKYTEIYACQEKIAMLRQLRDRIEAHLYDMMHQEKE